MLIQVYCSMPEEKLSRCDILIARENVTIPADADALCWLVKNASAVLMVGKAENLATKAAILIDRAICDSDTETSFFLDCADPDIRSALCANEYTGRNGSVIKLVAAKPKAEPQKRPARKAKHKLIAEKKTPPAAPVITPVRTKDPSYRDLASDPEFVTENGEIRIPETPAPTPAAAEKAANVIRILTGAGVKPGLMASCVAGLLEAEQTGIPIEDAMKASFETDGHTPEECGESLAKLRPVMDEVHAALQR